MSPFCYTGGFAAIPRPYPGLPELVAVAVLLAGAAGLRSAAPASPPLAVGAFSLGAATLVVTAVSRFGCRLGLRPAAALGLGLAVAALVAAGVGRRPAG